MLFLVKHQNDPDHEYHKSVVTLKLSAKQNQLSTYFQILNPVIMHLIIGLATYMTMIKT